VDLTREDLFKPELIFRPEIARHKEMLQNRRHILAAGKSALFRLSDATQIRPRLEQAPVGYLTMLSRIGDMECDATRFCKLED
jgi:hypothetical protein